MGSVKAMTCVHLQLYFIKISKADSNPKELIFEGHKLSLVLESNFKFLPDSSYLSQQIRRYIKKKRAAHTM